MFPSNCKSQLITIMVVIASLIAAAGCNRGIRIERVIITPSSPSPFGTAQINITPATPPAKLAPGQKAELTIDVKGLSVRDVVLWSAEKGKFEREPDRTSTTYVAPDEPGPYRITCEVTSNGQVAQVQIPIEVVAQAPRKDANGNTSATPVPPAKETPVTQVSQEDTNAKLQQAVTASGPYYIEDGNFIPCGWMGDAEQGTKHVEIDDRSRDQPHSGPTCQKWTYKPGPVGWAAVGWQFPGKPCNWGAQAGKNLGGRKFTQVTFWARGVPDSEGNLPKLQFKAGGNTDPTKKYRASFVVEGDFMKLTPDWRQYTLDIQGQNLSMVVGAFTWVIRAKDSPNGATFYLSEIAYR